MKIRGSSESVFDRLGSRAGLLPPMHGLGFRVYGQGTK